MSFLYDVTVEINVSVASLTCLVLVCISKENLLASGFFPTLQMGAAKQQLYPKRY